MKRAFHALVGGGDAHNLVAMLIVKTVSVFVDWEKTTMAQLHTTTASITTHRTVSDI